MCNKRQAKRSCALAWASWGKNPCFQRETRVALHHAMTLVITVPGPYLLLAGSTVEMGIRFLILFFVRTTMKLKV
eukprot:scaffold8371_cov71-Skeletonema_dohrnii-CCMP3373.AAC.2